MSLKNYLRNRIRHCASLGVAEWEYSTRDSRNTEVVLGSLLNSLGFLSPLHFPVPFVEFMRSCLESHCPHSLKELKVETETFNSAARRFAMLKEQLVNSIPPVEFSVALDIASIADRNRALSDAYEVQDWAGDMGLLFSQGSSFGNKGRILFNIVRFMHPIRCLELGTAFGMSALFILAALRQYSPSGSLATLEGWQTAYGISSEILKQQYGDMVSCHLGRKDLLLPELAKSLRKIDFLFHDCGHSGAQYVNDFRTVVDYLAPGAVVLFDDIRWEDARFHALNACTYEGWTTVASSPRVREAIEIDGSMGLLHLS